MINKNIENNIVKKMGYNSYYINKISSIKDKKKRGKYLFKLVSTFVKFHNTQCNIKNQFYKNIQYGGKISENLDINTLINLIANKIKNLETLSALQKFKIKDIEPLRYENTNYKKINKELQNTEKELRINLKKDKEQIYFLENDFRKKNNLSIAKIKKLENMFTNVTITQIYFLKSILLTSYTLYTKFNDFSRLLELMNNAYKSNATTIQKAKMNNERLDFTNKKNYEILQKAIYLFNYSICSLFQETGILVISDIIPIKTIKDNYLGWKNKHNNNIIYKRSGTFVNTDTKITFIELSQIKHDINNFDNISKHILNFDEAKDKLLEINDSKLLMIISEGLNILLNKCVCDSRCTYQFENKTSHWCKLENMECIRGVQGRLSNSKNCNPLSKILSGVTRPINITEKSNKPKEYYIGTYPYAHSLNEKNNIYCLHDKNLNISLSINCKENKIPKIKINDLIELRQDNIHFENLTNTKDNIDNMVETIKKM